MKGGDGMKKGFVAAVAVLGTVASTALIANLTNAFGFRFGTGSEHAVERNAEILGLMPEELQTELETKSFSDILQEQGVTKDEFRQQLEQQATEQMKVHGLSDEEVQSRFTEREQRIQAHQEALANLMGIDTETLNTELENSALPELLDKYNVSHVDLHDAMQTLRDESPHNGRGQRGFDLAQ